MSLLSTYLVLLLWTIQSIYTSNCTFCIIYVHSFIGSFTVGLVVFFLFVPLYNLFCLCPDNESDCSLILTISIDLVLNLSSAYIYCLPA